MSTLEKIIEKAFPSGYEEIKLPIRELAHKCKNCNGKKLTVLFACKEKGTKRVLLICKCLKCESIGTFYNE